ncbi:MAG: SMC family ATPase [Actinomycetota bacterium]
MRPLRVDLEGFGAFRDRTEIDFAGLDLVALVGPTGSGKSTVIDAITFALYGSVARYDNPSLVAPVISQLAVEARVRFDFELAGARYSAVRVVRRAESNASPGSPPRAKTREARLERWHGPDPDGPTTVLAGSVREMDAEVQALIGLDFSQFTRTIVLPQGAFAEFLTDDPANRQRLLRRLLDLGLYADMAAQARERATRAGYAMDAQRAELERLAAATPAARLALAEQGERVDGFAGSLGDQLAEIERHDVELSDRRATYRTTEAAIADLAAVAVPDHAAAVHTELEQARLAAVAAEADLAAARTELQECRVAADAAGDAATLARTADLLVRREALVSQIRDVDAERGTAEADATTAQAEQVRLTGEMEVARAALAAHRQAADAAVWVHQLRAGEACPVCEQTVHEVPATASPDALATADELVATVAVALDDATVAAARAHGRTDAAAAAAVRHRAELTEIDERLAGQLTADELAAGASTLDRVTGDLQRAEAAAVASSAAAAAVDRADTAAGRARAAVDAISGREADLRPQFVAQRDRVTALGAPAWDPDQPLANAWARLTVWATDRRTALGEQLAEIEAAGVELRAARSKLATDLWAQASAAGLDTDVDLDTADSDDVARLAPLAAAARARLDAEMAALDAGIGRRTELERQAAELDEEQTVHESLGRHLAANGFERWLLQEALDHLVHHATLRLHELSNGRYSLEVVDGSFAVRDHGNADERRDVRTLSGGEIFLASLSLALALAESIAELATTDGPRLESIFLDEGFGTLDPETLDVLASAIEELSAAGRLVTVVTHVRDLAERMPVRFEVRSAGGTSTIDRVDR